MDRGLNIRIRPAGFKLPALPLTLLRFCQTSPPFIDLTCLILPLTTTLNLTLTQSNFKMLVA